ncbi:hypothetical protein [Actinoplanes sp. M2I2]|uniref:hypothetical protein n=1 Tax=Actinoplanes sp. M2I2 TaxID=1734444 RepID=UPI00202218B8|nr:hypothetical protein [Actinoplanes sp. M2I2]
MDVDEASRSLAEIDKRQQETLERGGPRRLPAWFTYGGAAALTLGWAGTDLTRPASTILTAVSAVALIALAWALERSTGVRLRRRSLRYRPLLAFVAAVVVTGIGVGTVLRLFDVPVAGTIGGLAAGAVWIGAMGIAQTAATTRRPS